MTFEVPFIRPVFPPSAQIASDFDDIVASNWFTNFGPKEREFAQLIADRVGSDFHAVTFANATIALLAVLQATLGRGDGTRQVAVPSFTFAAGAEAIEWVGYRPLFIDIDPVTLQPTTEGLDGVELAGVLLCNTFGIGTPAIAEWEAWAESRGIPLIIDSAAGFGSRYADGSPVGRAGRAEVFSFHATKPFAIGEGGAVVTRHADLAREMAEFQNFGFGEGRAATHLGLNGKLSEFAAAIGLRQFEHFDRSLGSRQAVLSAYRDALAGDRWAFPENAELSSVCFAAVVASDPELRDRALSALGRAGVEARAYYSPPVHLHPHFVGSQLATDLAGTLDIVRRIISIPVHQDMEERHLAAVISAIEGVA